MEDPPKKKRGRPKGAKNKVKPDNLPPAPPRVTKKSQKTYPNKGSRDLARNIRARLGATDDSQKGTGSGKVSTRGKYGARDLPVQGPKPGRGRPKKDPADAPHPAIVAKKVREMLAGIDDPRVRKALYKSNPMPVVKPPIVMDDDLGLIAHDSPGWITHSGNRDLGAMTTDFLIAIDDA